MGKLLGTVASGGGCYLTHRSIVTFNLLEREIGRSCRRCEFIVTGNPVTTIKLFDFALNPSFLHGIQARLGAMIG